MKCWNRFDHTYQPDDVPKALAVVALEEENDLNLYADSGATTHVINDPGMIHSTKKYIGNEKMYVGNGEVLNHSYRNW